MKMPLQTWALSYCREIVKIFKWAWIKNTSLLEPYSWRVWAQGWLSEVLRATLSKERTQTAVRGRGWPCCFVWHMQGAIWLNETHKGISYWAWNGQGHGLFTKSLFYVMIISAGWTVSHSLEVSPAKQTFYACLYRCFPSLLTFIIMLVIVALDLYNNKSGDKCGTFRERA